MTDELVQALKEQTQAITALANSVMLLVDYLAEEQAEDAPPMQFLDGSPCQ